jgi:prepilin-type processing-associated H-X9-DG protein/prepilin-type N-terminal cleavage/methylation domain-containing protein
MGPERTSPTLSLQTALAGVLAAMLAVAVVAKGSAMGELIYSIERMKFLPRWARGVLPFAVLSGEIWCVGMLLGRRTRTAGLYATLALLTVFTAYLFVRVLRPDGSTRPCFAGLTVFPFLKDDRVSLVRNALLLALGVVALRSRGTNLRLRWTVRKRAPSTASVAHRGLTLVEVLLAVGVIGILMGLLLGAVSQMQRRSRVAACQFNLREIGQVGRILESEHEGYLPLDGLVAVAEGTMGEDSLPRSLGDPLRRRYAYTPDTYPLVTTTYGPPTFESPTPFLVAVLQCIRAPSVGEYPTAAWSAVAEGSKGARMLHCPESTDDSMAGFLWEDGAPSSVLVVGETGYISPWRVCADYKTNGAVLGFSQNRSLDRFFLRGHIGKVRAADRVALVVDATAVGTAITPLTRGQMAGVRTLMSPLDSRSAQIDERRHAGRINVLFVDGHVESVRADDASLGRVLLVED